MDIFNRTISNELFFVYALIALVIILIIVIIIIDKKESKNQNQNLFDTLNMKAIHEPTVEVDNELDDEITKEIELLEITKKHEKTVKKEENKNINTELINTIKEIKRETEKGKTNLKEEKKSTESKESTLGKTQAQIRVEEITKALNLAQIDEKIEESKYKMYEEEEEKNAIISYNELKESYDRLYDQNEKNQYLEDDKIPININELYEYSKKDNKEEIKVKLDNFDDFKKVEVIKEDNTTFKSSPLISPVYGIQKPPVGTNMHISNDQDIENANEFLKNLKELKNNLD